MSPAPGGILWLLGHELRLAWYGAGRAPGRRGPAALTFVLGVAGWIVLHVASWGLLTRLGADGMRDPVLAIVATLLALSAGTFMLSAALKSSVLALFERGDLDLLLSSPLPSRSIFAVRLLGVAGSAAGLFVYLFGPLANVALVLGHPGWLGIYGTLAALALLAACAGMLATLSLVRLLGARRTRVLAQVLAGIAGGLLFLLAQSANFVGHGGGAGVAALTRRVLAKGAAGATGALWLPGRAALGSAMELLILATLAAAAFALTVARTHRFFAHGLQLAAGASRVPRRPAGAIRLGVRASLFDTVVAKEWKLIARDPQLVSHVLLQCVYLLPLLAIILRGSATSGPPLAAGLALLCSSLAGGLAWIVISAEEAPDLLRSSPAAWRIVRPAKLAAATMPVLLLVALPLLWLVMRDPATGLLACFTTVGSVLGAALVVQWTGRPAARAEFRMRGKENLLCSMFELLGSACWGGLAWELGMLVRDSSPAVLLGATGALAGALLTLVLAWSVRRL